MKLLFFLFGFALLNAQPPSQRKDHKIILELGIILENSSKISKNTPAFALGFWYQYSPEDNARLELGGNIKSGGTKYSFIYGKGGGNYPVESKTFILNLGGRLVKEFSIKNQKIEWISELTLNTLFFDGMGIPDDPITEDENSTQIIIDAESISTLQFGQGLRIWKRNIGFGIKASVSPYRFWYKTTVPNQFNIFSAEATVSIKL